MAGLIFASPDDRSAKDFYKLYFDTFGQHAIADAAEAYDVATLFIQAAGAGPLQAHLSTVRDFSGIFGVYSVNPQRTFSLHGVLKQVGQDGNFELLR